MERYYSLFSSSHMTVKIKLINKMRGREKDHIFCKSPQTTHVEYVIELSAYCNRD